MPFCTLRNAKFKGSASAVVNAQSCARLSDQDGRWKHAWSETSIISRGFTPRRHSVVIRRRNEYNFSHTYLDAVCAFCKEPAVVVANNQARREPCELRASVREIRSRNHSVEKKRRQKKRHDFSGCRPGRDGAGGGCVCVCVGVNREARCRSSGGGVPQGQRVQYVSESKSSFCRNSEASP